MFSLLSLDEWWQLLNPVQHVFWTIAIISSVLFLIMFGLSLLGVGNDADVDVDVDTDIDIDTDHPHDYHVDKDFSAFSIRSVVAFFTFFSWTGVYYLSQGHSTMFATTAGVLAGGVAMFVVAYMIFQFARLEQSGTMNPLNALQSTGEVYLTIPQHLEGKGKIHVVVDGSLHEFEAETRGDILRTGSQVKIVEVLENDVLLVEPVIIELEQ